MSVTEAMPGCTARRIISNEPHIEMTAGNDGLGEPTRPVLAHLDHARQYLLHRGGPGGHRALRSPRDLQDEAYFFPQPLSAAA
jgi:hypothetical protein